MGSKEYLCSVKGRIVAKDEAEARETFINRLREGQFSGETNIEVT